MTDSPMTDSPLKLFVLDTDDLAIVSTHLQDAVVKASTISPFSPAKNASLSSATGSTGPRPPSREPPSAAAPACASNG